MVKTTPATKKAARKKLAAKTAGKPAKKRPALPKPQTVLHPEVCKDYAKRMKALPEILPHGEIEAIVQGFLSTFYVQALGELEPVVTRKDLSLHKDKKEKLNTLFTKARTALEQEGLETLVGQSLARGYQMRVYLPGASPRDLARDIGTVGTCRVRKSDWNREENLAMGRWLMKDTELGACLNVIGERRTPIGNTIPQAYMRLYVARTKNGEQALFIDTIESGNIGWDRVQAWAEEGRGHELLYALASAVYIARKLGMATVIAGEEETQDIATALGFGERNLFKETDSWVGRDERKIGIPVESEDGDPPVYQLNRSHRRRVIPVDGVRAVDAAERGRLLDAIAGFVGSSPKVRANRSKMYEVGLSLLCLEAMERLDSPQREGVRERIASLRQEYVPADLGLPALPGEVSGESGSSATPQQESSGLDREHAWTSHDALSPWEKLLKDVKKYFS